MGTTNNVKYTIRYYVPSYLPRNRNRQIIIHAKNPEEAWESAAKKIRLYRTKGYKPFRLRTIQDNTGEYLTIYDRGKMTV